MKILQQIMMLVLVLSVVGCRQGDVKVENEHFRVSWKETSEGWKVATLQVQINNSWKTVGKPSGQYTLLYSATKPDTTSLKVKTSTGVGFPEKIYKYQQGIWKEATSPVSLNTAGESVSFFPRNVKVVSGNEIVFSEENDWATFTSTWKIDPKFSTDIIVTQHAVLKKDGYYSLGSPSLVTIDEKDMAWATVPGYFQGNEIQKDFVLAYAYGQGVPRFPAVYRERCVSTMSSIIDTHDSVSISVIPTPGLDRDPWKSDHKSHDDWNIGISHRNRDGALSPSLFYPVLGEPLSLLKTGDVISYEFRFSFQDGNWFTSLNHAANDIYRFKETLQLRTNKQSLTSRVEAMHHYVTDPTTSLWNVESFQGLKIGGQSYLGGVVGSQRDAMKNSDYGAMWMLASATDDPLLRTNVLPYALNFKLAQQQVKPGFFQGAAMGQYYLAKRKLFVEEWGEFVEPISLTYYTMLDVGNILLFDPDNQQLRERLRLGAELLLKWQKEDGSWEVAYEQEKHEPLFTDIKDLRPTFYGLIVAHRILKDPKYLIAAEKGAQWIIKEAVNKGNFLGVCGDARYAPDFATAQTSQALLDLYDITGNEAYKTAAIATARLYTTSVYTHPIPTREKKIVNGVEREDWEISQSGLSFEHGGIIGSAQRTGPIQLASHAGLFVRVFKLTGDSLLIDMARSAAIGRDAFVDSATSVASYYWIAMNKGAGPYPHHAWWQIGWITDYLMSEAQLRSNDKIIFPRGFVTPKVGPHQSYGFAPGKIYNEPADLIIREGLFIVPDPNVECISAQSKTANRVFAILLNDRNESKEISLQIDLQKLKPGAKVKSITELTENKTLDAGTTQQVRLPNYGMKVYAIDF